MSRWRVVVPLKGGAQAKSRLRERIGAPANERLAWAMAQDCLAAVSQCPVVAQTIVVCADPVLGQQVSDAYPAVIVVEQQVPGLNQAVAEGFRACPPGPVVALLGDLPALTPAVLARALDEVEQALTHAELVVLPDRSGAGTVLAAGFRTRDWLPDTVFGAGSAARFARRGGYPLPSSPTAHLGLRDDVDTLEDLRRVTRIGLGPATTAFLEQVSDLGELRRG